MYISESAFVCGTVSDETQTRAVVFRAVQVAVCSIRTVTVTDTNIDTVATVVTTLFQQLVGVFIQM